MKRFFLRFATILTLLALVAGAALLVRHRKAQLAHQPPPKIRPVPVAVKSCEQGRLPLVRHYLGTLTPEAEAVISAQTTGYLTALYKDVGDRLTTGETLADVDMRLSEARKNDLPQNGV